MVLIAVRGSTDIDACPDVVWAALHDPERLALCLPGCRTVRKADAARFFVQACVRFGPIRIGFEGSIDVEQGTAPSRLVLAGHGRAGRAGAAAGTATISLRERNGGCRLFYAIEAEPTGPIAQLGPVVLGGLAEGMSDLFAARFSALFDRSGIAPVQTARRRTNASSRATISASS